MSSLQTALRQYFGYNSFRPLQREIISDVLAGQDVFALIPTGSGKSLCYQLPSVVRDGLTVVVSPLISLMKDQVDALQQNGIRKFTKIGLPVEPSIAFCTTLSAIQNFGYL